MLGYLSGLVGYDQFTSDLTISTFDSGLSKSLVCAVKVGDGYSTNSMCERTACGGSGCALPNSYLITPTNDQLFCSKEEEISYTIGCASGNTYAACLAACVPNSADYDDCMLTPVRFNLYTDLDQGTFTKDLIFRVDGVEETVPRVMTCTSATPQTNDVKTPHCTVSLPTGKELAFKI